MIYALILAILSSVSSHPSSGIEIKDASHDSLTVYVFLLDECVISQFYTPELSRLSNHYKNKKVGFVGYFPNELSSETRIDGFGKKYGLPFPLLPDYDKSWTRRFGITITPEVAVWDHRSEQLLYRGRIDDSYVRVGKRNRHPKHHDLEDIIESWRAGEPAGTTVTTQAIGCFISFTKS